MAQEASGAGASSSPSNQEYLDAANWAYNTYRPGKSQGPADLPDGMTFLTTGPHQKPLISYVPSVGLYAAALKTAEGAVITVYEGTNFTTGNASFTTGQALDDLAIYTGLPAPSYAPSARFARQVLAAATRHGDTAYLDGHSLGAAEAEYAATRTGQAGVTFGTPGIPQYLGAGTTSHLTNYVEVNDPVANYAANTPYVVTPTVYEPYSPLDPHPTPSNPNPRPIVLSDTIQHYNGQIVLPDLIDQPGNPSILDAAQKDYQAGDLTGAVVNLALGLGDHLLSAYANGLGLTAPSVDLSSGAGPGGTSVDASWIEAALTGGGGVISSLADSLPIGHGLDQRLAAEARHLGIDQILKHG